MLCVTAVILLGVSIFLFVRNQGLSTELADLNQKYSQTQLELDRLRQVLDNEQATQEIPIYFPRKPQSVDNPEVSFAVMRNLLIEDLPQAIMEVYATGLLDEELASGYYFPSGDPEISLNKKLDLRGNSVCDGANFTTDVTENTLTVKFCRDLMLSGVLADASVQDAMKRSLLGIEGISKVIFLNKDGNCMFDESGLNLCLDKR